MKRAACVILYLLVITTAPSFLSTRNQSESGTDIKGDSSSDTRGESGADSNGGSDTESRDIHGINLDLDNDSDMDYSIRLIPPEGSLIIMPVQKNSRSYQFMDIENYMFDIFRNGKAAGHFEIILHRMKMDSCAYFFDFSSLDKDLALNVEIKAINTGGILSAKEASYEGNRLVYSLSEHSGRGESLHATSSFIDCGRDDNGKYLWVGGIARLKELGNTVYEVSSSIEDGYELQNNKKDAVVLIKMGSSVNCKTRTQGMLSVVPLMDWSDSQACKILTSLDLNRLKMFFPDGIYVKTPSNYVPGTPDSLYRTPSALHIRECAKLLGSGQLFRNLSISLMYAYSEAYNQDGYIPTGPRSLWLDEEYGIGYGFYDTRFNSDTAWSLMAIYDEYRDDRVMDRIKNYISFYMNYSKTFAFETSLKASFVPDYIDGSLKSKTTLCSLNHFTAEMCVLYRYHYLTGDSEALERAHMIRDSIEATSGDWIRDDGDLWYAVTPSGNFVKDDYSLLTYHDLQKAVELMEQLGEKVPEGIAGMLESKRKWAEDKGYL